MGLGPELHGFALVLLLSACAPLAISEDVVGRQPLVGNTRISVSHSSRRVGAHLHGLDAEVPATALLEKRLRGSRSSGGLPRGMGLLAHTSRSRRDFGDPDGKDDAKMSFNAKDPSASEGKESKDADPDGVRYPDLLPGRDRKDGAASKDTDSDGKSASDKETTQVPASRRGAVTASPSENREAPLHKIVKPKRPAESVLEWMGVVLFIITGICMLGYVAIKGIYMYKAYRSDIDEAKTTTGFQDYLQYRFELWFEKTPAANAYILIVVSCLTLFVGACLYGFIMDVNLITATWKIFTWLVAPDGGAMEAHFNGQFLGGMFSVAGLVIFALLLMLMQDTFTGFLAAVRRGTCPVLESDHYFVIGFTEESIVFVQEMCKAYEDIGGVTIVLLSDKVSKPDMEERMSLAEVDFCNSKVLLRTGSAHCHHELKRRAAHLSQCCVIFPEHAEDKEQSDAFTLRTLMCLRSRGWPLNGRIVVVLSLQRNMQLFEEAGGSNTDIILLDNFLARILVSSSRKDYTGYLLSKLLGFEGSEFYLSTVPDHLVGLTFAEAAQHYERAVLTGVMETRAMLIDREGPSAALKDEDEAASAATDSSDELEVWQDATAGGKKQLPMRPGGHGKTCLFCPGADYKLQANQEIVLLAEDSTATATIASGKPAGPAKDHRARPQGQQDVLRQSSRMSAVSGKLLDPVEPETIVIFGWSELVCLVLMELDEKVAAKSKFVILSPTPVDVRQRMLEQAQCRNGRRLQNIELDQIFHVVGAIGSRYQLDELPEVMIEDASRVFIVADAMAKDQEHADACTLATFLQIHDVIVEKHKPTDMPIVLEIRDPLSELRCSYVKANDFINTAKLPSQILAAVAFQPAVHAVLSEITASNSRARFSEEKLSAYVKSDTSLPTLISFTELTALVGACGDVLFGWSKSYEDTQDGILSDDQGEAGKYHKQMNKFLLNKSHRARSGLSEFVLNPPDKTTPRCWSNDSDRILVLKVD